MIRPTCLFPHCTKPADYYDPTGDDVLCKDHAIATGALTNSKCWLWNERRSCWDRS